MQKIFFKDEVDGKTVSSLWLYTVDLPSRHLAVIEEVQTETAFRREGRATRLIERAIETARDLGCTVVELTVREDAPHVQHFYKSLGFTDRLNRAFRLRLE